jgi:hypothetical protein
VVVAVVAVAPGVVSVKVVVAVLVARCYRATWLLLPVS